MCGSRDWPNSYTSCPLCYEPEEEEETEPEPEPEPEQ